MTKVALKRPISTDMIDWLIDNVGRNSHNWSVETVYDNDDDGNDTSDILSDTVIFKNDKDATMFMLRWAQ
jgi:hypothetical protein